ncbi:MAG: hypothetical protein DSM106950_21715 [Stigonema ocellatum SAG 48.90 = DSM 106950]|nr:hypothetical protein [Stigonema ocellatum SAG 48.90 = DSM 106950]
MSKYKRLRDVATTQLFRSYIHLPLRKPSGAIVAIFLGKMIGIKEAIAKRIWVTASEMSDA